MKIRIISLFILLLTIFTINCYAQDDVYSNNNTNNITITLENESDMTEEQIEYIENLVLKYHLGENINNEASTYSILCTLLGHKTEENSVTATEHKVRVSSPRCYMTIYNVETCSRCDYENITVINEMYVYCCPEE